MRPHDFKEGGIYFESEAEIFTTDQAHREMLDFVDIPYHRSPLTDLLEMFKDIFLAINPHLPIEKDRQAGLDKGPASLAILALKFAKNNSLDPLLRQQAGDTLLDYEQKGGVIQL